MNAPDPLGLPPTPDPSPDDAFDTSLDAWLDDALAPDDARAVADRVASDPVWAEAAATARSLRAALATAPLPMAPPDFRARVLAAVSAKATVPSDAPPPHRAALRADAPAAARPSVGRRHRLVRTAAGMLAAIALLTVGVYQTRPAADVYTAAEVAQARAEAEWALAYLNGLNARTGAAVADALPPLPAPTR